MRRGALRRNASDALFLFVVPISAALLPWRLGFALLRRVARSKALFADVVAADLAIARGCLPIADATDFAWRCRLCLLVDRCDSFLTALRSERWWRRHVDVDGDGAAALHSGLLLNCHWGAGHWIWRILAGEGIAAHFVARRAQIADVGRGRLSRGYLDWRAWALRHIGCAGVIYTGASRAALQRVLAHGDSLLGMLDVPANAQQRRVQVSLLGRPARLPLGLATLAVEAGVTVSLLSCGLDCDTGRRHLQVVALPATLGADEIVSRYAAHLQHCIESAPALWHMWPQAPRYWAGAEETGE